MMLKTLMTTTAVVAMLAGIAFAQEAAPAVTGAAATGSTPVASILANGYAITEKDNLATEIIGKQVYASAASDAQHIGDVNNIVIGTSGQIAAVIIGVGGFLGIGEKNVAVNYAELEWVTGEDGTERFVLPTTKQALETATDFQTTDTRAPADLVNPPADNAISPADNTMAPATPAPAAN